MGIFDQDLILPGAVTEIDSDYSFGYDTSKFGTTDAVTVVGTAFNGPVGKPIPIYSPEHARYVFGASYDHKTRRTATLVAEITDTWDRGCRTIYAVRVSGKNISKDFQFAIETNLKLRVSGIFPSNDNKDVYMVYDNTADNAKIKVFKPAKRATIQEKKQGMVEREESILVTTIDLDNGYGITPESRLVDMIKIVNEHPSNNVIRVSIVDENGADVTIASEEAQALSVGAMLPGAYFVGRNASKCVAVTNVAFKVTDETHKPFDGFTGPVYKELVINTDVSKDLPIFGSREELNTKFSTVGISMTVLFDFLAVPGKVDLAFSKDAVDYEEVDIKEFELYKRLGSGFAITAKLDSNGKVKETPANDPLRVMPINDGIYSMLENLKSKYRVLTVGVADEPIASKMPHKSDFAVTTPAEIKILSDKIVATPKIDAKDATNAKKYSFKFEKIEVDAIDPVTVKASLYTAKVIKHVAKIAALTELDGKTFAEGTMFLMVSEGSGALHRISGGKAVAMSSATTHVDMVGKLLLADGVIYEGVDSTGTLSFSAVLEASYATKFSNKDYVLVESGDIVSIYELAATLNPIGGLTEVLDAEEDMTLVTVQSVDLNSNVITVKSTSFDYLTVTDLIDELNEKANLKRFFTFAIDSAAVADRDTIIDDLSLVFPVASTAAADRTQGFDTNLYIPYKTTDIFARQLAQHCTYTSLKTAPTHGFMGCAKLYDVNIDAIARRVDKLVGIDLDMYAKKSNGVNMLDRNNMPYPIGKNISVTFLQYAINTEDGFNYISNGAAGYAGMVATLPLEQSSTNQPINIPTPMFELTNYQLGKLTQKGFVTVKQSYTQGFVVTDGITMAPATSPFRRLSVSRIINSVEEIIRAAVEPYIGKPNSLSNRNAMQTALRSDLGKIKDKFIQDFDFRLVIDPAIAKLGIVEIDYKVVPIYEIREVRNRISVKESL